MFERFVDIDALVDEYCPFGEVGQPVWNNWKEKTNVFEIAQKT